MSDESKSALEIATAAMKDIVQDEDLLTLGGARMRIERALAAMQAAPVLARDGWGAELRRVEQGGDENAMSTYTKCEDCTTFGPIMERIESMQARLDAYRREKGAAPVSSLADDPAFCAVADSWLDIWVNGKELAEAIDAHLREKAGL